MKSVIAFLLMLAFVAVMLPLGNPAHAATVTKKPFYMVNVESVLWADGDYVLDMPFFSAHYIDGSTAPVVSWNQTSDIEELATELKSDFDSRPEGTRYLFLDLPYRAIDKLTEDYMYFQPATESIQEWVEEFLAEYKRIGGKLDGIATDVEYIYGSSYELWSIIYKYRNKNCYWDIVNNPKYKTVLRPKLEKWGYQFWPKDKQDSEKSEIWSMCPENGMNTREYSIWNHVMGELLTESLNASIFEPMLKHYPHATLCDYGRMDSYGWQKTHSSGMMSHSTGNGIKVGNVSNRQCYPYEPWENHIGRYSTPVAFNDAKYAATPYNVAQWGVTQSKNMYEADSNHRISSWMTFFNFQPYHPGTASNTPYYSETIYHIGLLDPQPFYGYILESEVVTYGADNSDPNVSDYEYVMQVVQELMAELTRVAGYTDRKPIYIPANWNSHFMLSGMYANGRNIFRITPDTYTGTSLEAFKVKDSDPTFQIAGQTITFPQGKIIADSKISQVGTCGYWVETPANVTPIVTGSPDRYEKDPSFLENFEGFTTGAELNEETTDAWESSSASINVQDCNGGKALALTDTVQLKNINAPKNITAGDSYAKQQAWQVTVTVPEGGELNLLRGGDKDWGFKIAGGKVYCDVDGAYKELSGANLTAGSTYIFKREVDFCTEGQCSSIYTVLDASGNVLGTLQGGSPNVSAPVEAILFDAKKVTGTAYIDDYKIYPVGLSADFEVYDAVTGYLVDDATQVRTEDTAYRVSWLNATGEDVIAKIYNNGVLIDEFTMGVGQDGQKTGVVKTDGKPVLLTITTESPSSGSQPPSINDPSDSKDPAKPGFTDGKNPANKTGGLTVGKTLLIVLITTLIALGGVFAVFWFVIRPKRRTESEEDTTESQPDDPSDLDK